MGPVSRTFRQRLGDRFQYYRHQVRGLRNLEDARRETGIDPKTIRGIEDGSGNPRLSSIEEYANGLRVDLEQILAETRVGDSPGDTSPEAERIAYIYSKLKHVNSRQLLFGMAEHLLAQENQIPEALGPSQVITPESAESAGERSKPARKARA